MARQGGYLESLLENDRPARLVGLFSGRMMKPGDLQRLVEACVASMRQEDRGASLTVSQLGSPDAPGTWRVTVVNGSDASPHDCLVQVFDMRDPQSPHRALLDHIGGRDRELSEAASHLHETAQSYLTVASGKLDDHERVHPFQNLVSLFASALGAAIVDPAAAIVTTDPGEWADAMEQSLHIEKEMGALRR